MTDRTFSIPALYAWRLKTVGSPLVNIDFFFFIARIIISLFSWSSQLTSQGNAPYLD